MKKLMLYSDQLPALRETADEALKKLIGKSHPCIGFIPSAADTTRKYFNDRRDFYRGLGMELAEYFELDNDWRPEKLKVLLACDAIHLSGGNTYYFLSWLRKRQMMDTLTKYVTSGGVLIGVSAGAILMTPDITTAAFSGDPQMPAETNTAGMGLVDFAFIPHYGNRPLSIDDVKKYAREKQMPVYLTRDTGAIMVDEGVVNCIGDVFIVD
ncbi:MAG: Type 1 glutamine amidotransferase-like domain-containing protein [Dehalococcoidales bacterium]